MPHETTSESCEASGPVLPTTAPGLVLYASYACPWSHRVLIARALYALESVVAFVDVEPVMDTVGWRLSDGHLIDRYKRYDPTYAGKATVPLMIDRATGMIVSNESAVLMRLLGTAMAGDRAPLFPPEHAVACETWNFRIQEDINARVYDHGLAASGAMKSRRTAALIEALSKADRHLAERRFLVTDERPLEPDWRLWSSLARYDIAYRPLLLSSDAPALSAFPNLSRLCDDLAAVPGIGATYRPSEIFTHYSARVRDLEAASHQLSNGDTI